MTILTEVLRNLPALRLLSWVHSRRRCVRSIHSVIGLNSRRILSFFKSGCCSRVNSPVLRLNVSHPTWRSCSCRMNATAILTSCCRYLRMPGMMLYRPLFYYCIRWVPRRFKALMCFEEVDKYWYESRSGSRRVPYRQGDVIAINSQLPRCLALSLVAGNSVFLL